jgi:hypothetical protein
MVQLLDTRITVHIIRCVVLQLVVHIVPPVSNSFLWVYVKIPIEAFGYAKYSPLVIFIVRNDARRLRVNGVK